jgi:hypothetical protein
MASVHSPIRCHYNRDGRLTLRRDAAHLIGLALIFATGKLRNRAQSREPRADTGGRSGLNEAGAQWWV